MNYSAAELPFGETASNLDMTSPSYARMHGFFLGGKDNQPPDRAAAEKVRGSYLVILHGTLTEQTSAAAPVYERFNLRAVPRTDDQVKAFFGDFELVPPGLVSLSQRRSTMTPIKTICRSSPASPESRKRHGRGTLTAPPNVVCGSAAA